jgi:protein O-mannosyl-transferase
MKALEKYLDNKRNLIVALTLPVILVYAKSLYYGFTTLDEQWLVIRSTSFNSDWRNLFTVFQMPVSFVYYRPFFMCSIIIDHQIAGISPFVYHATNLLWHLLATLLLYRFLSLTGARKVNAYVAALLFALHPIAVHAVAWVPGRNDLMMACFVLLSFNSLLTYLQKNKKFFLVLHVFTLVCAFFTKETAIVIPVISLAILYIYSKKKPLFYLYYFGSVMILTAMYLFLRSNITEALPDTERTLWLNSKDIFLVTFMQLGKAYYPLFQSVSPVLQNSLALFGMAVFVISILFWKTYGKDKRKAVLSGLIFVGFMILPAWFGVTKGSGEHYEHRIYCSMIGLALFFTCFEMRASSKVVQFALFSVPLLYGITTFTRMKVYANEEVFVDAGIKERPDYYWFYLQKGDQLLNKNNIGAIEYYNKAIELRPSYGISYANRGSAFMKAEMFPEALEDYNKAIALTGYNEKMYNSRCYCNSRMGNGVEAKQDLDSLRKYSPHVVEPRMEQIVNEVYQASISKDSLR